LGDYQGARVLERFTAGHWDDTITEIEAGAALASETGQGNNPPPGPSPQSLIRFHRNDPPGPPAAARAAASGIGPRIYWSAWGQALLLEADGELADALKTLSDCWDRCARCGVALAYPVIGPDLVRLALAAGEARRAQEVAAAVTSVASRN